jgi:hypothetical protein
VRARQPNVGHLEGLMASPRGAGRGFRAGDPIRPPTGVEYYGMEFGGGRSALPPLRKGVRMMRFRLIAISAVALALALAASPVSAQGRTLSTTLSGAEEVPGPGDPDGTGFAVITLNQGQEEVCFDLTVSNIAPATAAHIHRGVAGVAGPVVVPLSPPTSGSSSGCVSAAPDLIKDIRKNPSLYYVNVHNADFPAGAVRGQLGD